MSITRPEMMMIIEAACKMAFEDDQFLPEEKSFLEKLGNLAKIAPEVMAENYDSDMLQSIDNIIDEIKSPEGKKLLLLTIAAVAAIDKEVHQKEAALIKLVAEKLNLHDLHIEKMGHIELAKKVMVLIKKHA